MIDSSHPRARDVYLENYECYTEGAFIPGCIAVSEQEIMHLHYRHLLSIMNEQSSSFSPAFPPDALQILRLMKGNQQCADCLSVDYVRGPNGEELSVEPLFAAVAYGTLVCRNCALSHLRRDNATTNSNVKELAMDDWSFHDVLALLEGGNERFRTYCALTSAFPDPSSNIGSKKEWYDTLYRHEAVGSFQRKLEDNVETVLRQHRSTMLHPLQQWSSEIGEYDIDEIYQPPKERQLRTVEGLSPIEFYTMVMKRTLPSPEEEKDTVVVERPGLRPTHGLENSAKSTKWKSFMDVFSGSTRAIENSDLSTRSLRHFNSSSRLAEQGDLSTKKSSLPPLLKVGEAYGKMLSRAKKKLDEIAMDNIDGLEEKHRSVISTEHTNLSTASTDTGLLEPGSNLKSTLKVGEASGKMLHRARKTIEERERARASSSGDDPPVKATEHTNWSTASTEKGILTPGRNLKPTLMVGEASAKMLHRARKNIDERQRRHADSDEGLPVMAVVSQHTKDRPRIPDGEILNRSSETTTKTEKVTVKNDKDSRLSAISIERLNRSTGYMGQVKLAPGQNLKPTLKVGEVSGKMLHRARKTIEERDRARAASADGLPMTSMRGVVSADTAVDGLCSERDIARAASADGLPMTSMRRVVSADTAVDGLCSDSKDHTMNVPACKLPSLPSPKRSRGGDVSKSNLERNLSGRSIMDPRLSISQESAASAETVKCSNFEGAGGKQGMGKSSEANKQTNAKGSDSEATLFDLHLNDKLSTLSQPIDPESPPHRVEPIGKNDDRRRQ